MKGWRTSSLPREWKDKILKCNREGRQYERVCMGSINCYIPNRSGDKIEIDMIMLCQKGIYVIENRNYSGWIFGDEKSKNWCEILKGKYFFL